MLDDENGQREDWHQAGEMGIDGGDVRDGAEEEGGWGVWEGEDQLEAQHDRDLAAAIRASVSPRIECCQELISETFPKSTFQIFSRVYIWTVSKSLHLKRFKSLNMKRLKI